MAKKKLNIAIIGGGFMGRTHSNAFRQAPEFFALDHEPVLKAVCTRNAKGAADFAANWGFEFAESDWRKLIDRKDIDLIDIASPNDTHAEIAIAAAAAGKMVMCEKPLGRTAAEAETMVAAVEKAKVPNMVWYNYRRVPAVTMAKQLIDEGRLGKIFHYRAKFLQDWTISADVPQGGRGTWRLDANVAGSGVTGDLLAHCIDTALWLNGGIASVTGATETFVKQRKHADTGETAEVKIDDAQRVPVALQERLARPVRGDALCPRAQSALHPGDQRRKGLDLLGPARPPSPAMVRPSRRGPAAWLALGTSPTANIPISAMVGARPADRVRAHLHPPGRRFPRRPRQRQAGLADLPRRARNGIRHGCRAESAKSGQWETVRN